MPQQTISIAIVQNKQQQLLISRRQKGQHLAGKWEFPGGKVEQGEALEVAMCRELKEEVGLTASEFTLFESLDFDYVDRLDRSRFERRVVCQCEIVIAAEVEHRLTIDVQ